MDGTIEYNCIFHDGVSVSGSTSCTVTNESGISREPMAAYAPDYTFTPAQSSGWHCDIFGMGGQIQIHPSKDSVPCWFWRKMQYLCFGNKWIRKE